MKRNGVNLGLNPQHRSQTAKILDEVYCGLSILLDANLKLFWMSDGTRIADLYMKKRDITWEQVNRLGLRISRLGGKPTLDPAQQEKKINLPQGDTKTLSGLTVWDLQAEDSICSVIREQVGALQEVGDWTSMTILRDILEQREELITQLEIGLEYEPILEYIWDDEDLSMHPQGDYDSIH